ncbi:hypothetical protein C7445_10928 [Alicyclobacillus sacchari]|uniref:Uncharacterized protein n=1 Tax=Alicyclobacillus sacchari TaxID=392010 RepID=A0A4R8LK91_9BACL|nr:hypothetical protein C7445_10928 [Alicyclobacillus sacchari]
MSGLRPRQVFAAAACCHGAMNLAQPLIPPRSSLDTPRKMVFRHCLHPLHKRRLMV